MSVRTNDGRFSGRVYADWIAQEQGEAGQWVEASAAGTVAQAMTVLSTSSQRWLVCAGARADWAQYVRDTIMEHAVMRAHATVYESLAAAEQARSRFESVGFERWAQGGGVRNLRYWSTPFLEVVP